MCVWRTKDQMNQGRKEAEAAVCKDVVLEVVERDAIQMVQAMRMRRRKSRREECGRNKGT